MPLLMGTLISPEWLARKLAKQRAWQEKLHSGQEYLIYITLGRMLEGLL